MSKRLLGGVGVGLTLGLALTLMATRTHGYAASYTVVWAAGMGALLLSGALLFLLFRRSRWLSAPTAIAAVALVLSWWISMSAAARLGAWDEPIVSFGPDVVASLVVVFEADVSERQINALIDHTLSEPHPNQGMSLKRPFSSLLRTSVEQHPALALQTTVDPQAVEGLEREIKRHPEVVAVLRDVAPNAARLPSHHPCHAAQPLDELDADIGGSGRAR